MYSDQDIESAVAAGVLPADAARALRRHVEAERQLPVADEEQFRLITGFNDIFVSIAAVILLVAVAWIGYVIPPHFEGNGPTPFMGLFAAATAWGLAEFFTRQRRMALPSILLLLAFVGGVFAAAVVAGFVAVGPTRSDNSATPFAVAAAVAGAIAAGSAWLHWRRFRVPITVAAGTAAGVVIVVASLAAAIGDAFAFDQVIIPVILLLGLGVFALAMWWDGSDRERRTRRSDVAFWLHLLAAPMIAHPVFHLLGVTRGEDIGAGAAVGVLAIYVLFGIVALAIDRRALLVSALAYVLFALTQLFRQFGAVELNVALTALVIGSALLLLSAFWPAARRLVVGRLPAGLGHRLPPTHAVAL